LPWLLVERDTNITGTSIVERKEKGSLVYNTGIVYAVGEDGDIRIFNPLVLRITIPQIS
jgi:hypothetical protein